MAQTPESKAKKKVRDLLDEFGAYYVSTVTGGYGKSGPPDITGCHAGRYFGVEVKADTDVTALQEDNLQQIREAGGYTFVCRLTKKGVATGYDELRTFLTRGTK